MVDPLDIGNASDLVDSLLHKMPIIHQNIFMPAFQIHLVHIQVGLTLHHSQNKIEVRGRGVGVDYRNLILYEVLLRELP